MSAAQKKILDKLYHQLEKLPKKAPDLKITRDKFNRLKKLYQKISGEPKISLAKLLDNITTHRAANIELFNKGRAPNLISRFLETLGFRMQTSTQKVYDAMEKLINEEIMQVHTSTDALPKHKSVTETGDYPKEAIFTIR